MSVDDKLHIEPYITKISHWMGNTFIRKYDGQEYKVGEIKSRCDDNGEKVTIGIEFDGRWPWYPWSIENFVKDFEPTKETQDSLSDFGIEKINLSTLELP